MHGRIVIFGLGLLVSACGSGGDGDDADASTSADAPPAPDANQTPDATVIPDANLPPDATPPALGCLGQPLPTTAPDPITISGNAFEPGIPGFTTDTPLENVTIEGYIRGDESTPFSIETSNALGNWSATVTTSDLPLNAYLRAKHTGHWTTYLYPSRPVASDLSGIQVVMTTDFLFNALIQLANTSHEDNKGWVSLIVLDCDDNPVEGAVVTSNPAAGEVAYVDGQTVSSSLPGTGPDGIAMLLNVPLGDVEVTASWNGMQFRTHEVVVNPVSEKKMITTTVQP